jgi:hypothetical protein
MTALEIIERLGLLANLSCTAAWEGLVTIENTPVDLVPIIIQK